MKIERRDFLKLMGFGGVVFVSGLGNLGGSAQAASGEENFFFVRLSDPPSQRNEVMRRRK